MPFPPVTPGGPSREPQDFQRASLEAIRQAAISVGDLPAAAVQTSTPPRAASPGGTGAAAGPCISFESLKSIKSNSSNPRIRKNPSPYGSVNYERSQIAKWAGKPVAAYKAHALECPSNIMLNQIPEEIDFCNLAMHGTNLQVILKAGENGLKAGEKGGQLVPVGNQLKNGGEVLTGESIASQQSLERVRNVCIFGGRSIEVAFERAASYADRAASVNIKVHAGRISEVPIVVIGDGRDTHKLTPRNNMSPTAGINPHCPSRGGSMYAGRSTDIDFKRLNIRGLLCRASDIDFVQQELKALERRMAEEAKLKNLDEPRLDLAVTSFEDFREYVAQNPDLESERAEGTSQRRWVLEKLTGRPLPKYPDFIAGRPRRPSSSDDEDFQRLQAVIANLS